MLRSSKDLEGCTIGATDGAIGHVDDLYFDDRKWVIRYLVVNTGSWLTNRKVLIAPVAILHVDWVQKSLSASITRQQVRNSPDIDTNKPVSRQHELEYLRYYNYPPYWEKSGVWSPGPNPNIPPLTSNYEWSGRPPIQVRMEREREAARGREPDDPHLRSCNEVVSYHIAAKDGDIGHACGLLVEAETWAIRYLVVDTAKWWFGHKVLVAPEWIEGVDWPERKIDVDLTRETLKAAPTYDPDVPLDGAFEVRMFEYYGLAAHRGDEANKTS
jgi:PRC-barrel domain